MLFNFLSGANPLIGLLAFLIVFSMLIVCITIHEFLHAFIASKLGDPTAKASGRVTLNPLAHLDPVGTLLLALVGFGWGKPVPFNLNFLRSPKRDAALISLAGPASNFLFAVVFGLIHKVFGLGFIGNILESLVYFNLILCFFNLIPVHPLDGFKVVWGFLPPDLSEQWLDLAPYGLWILLLLIFANVTDYFVSLQVGFLVKLLL